MNRRVSTDLLHRDFLGVWWSQVLIRENGVLISVLPLGWLMQRERIKSTVVERRKSIAEVYKEPSPDL